MRAIYVVVVLTLAAILAHADGLIYKLPKDGTWATYQVDGSRKTEGGRTPFKGTLRVASVGQVKEDGQVCRWIETVIEIRFEGDNVPTVPKEALKFMVPEKFLTQGQEPQHHVLRAWRRLGDGKPEKTTEPSPVLVGPPKDPRHLDKAEVESKLGKSTCEGVVGKVDIPMPGGPMMHGLVETRLHQDAPFGVVSSHWIIAIKLIKQSKDGTDREEAGTMEMKLRLIDFGDNAKSEMPDAK